MTQPGSWKNAPTRDREAELERLYRHLAPTLKRLLARNISAPPVLIDDACQFAWAALLHTRHHVVAGRELGWLLTTASREALLQLRATRRESPIDPQAPATEQLATVTSLTVPDPLDAITQRQRLAEIRRLPVRQQRMIWLHGLGYDYEEISGETGDSRRTVERQLMHARRRLDAVAGE
jgi:DNA-directed RNA polymerase specialized sigma24 family protein